MKNIVIIGAKQVGKTTLFRKLINLYSINNEKNYKFSPIINYLEQFICIEKNFYKLIDTPSFSFISKKNEIENKIEQKIKNLIEKSDLVLWIIDFIDEQTFLIKNFLKKKNISILLVYNKIDCLIKEKNIHQISKFKDFLSISALCNTDINKLAKKILEIIPNSNTNEQLNQLNKISLIIIGAPNSGKSTLMNSLLNADRSLTSTIAGTTKEPVIDYIKLKDINFQLIDTAGIYNGKEIQNYLWKKINLTLVIIDVNEPITKNILQITNLSYKNQKPLIIVINKIDLIKSDNIENELKKRLKSLSFCQIISISALKKWKITNLLLAIKKIIKQNNKQISNKELTENIKIIISKKPLIIHGKELKFYFARQEQKTIKYFILFVNNPSLVHFSYTRFLINQLRICFDLSCIPLKIIFKKSK